MKFFFGTFAILVSLLSKHLECPEAYKQQNRDGYFQTYYFIMMVHGTLHVYKYFISFFTLCILLKKKNKL